MVKHEQRLWHWLRDKMDGQWFHERFENRLQPNAPDLYYAHPTIPGGGWIELKVNLGWPAQKPTKIRWGKWTLGQQHWMRQHAESGGRAHLMLWVIETDELFVLNSRDALAYQGTLSQELLRVMHPPIKRRDCSADTILDKLRR